jgi:hypothetical protein
MENRALTDVLPNIQSLDTAAFLKKVSAYDHRLNRLSDY